MLWTPGYWGWEANQYHWHPGYWGHDVGFYGGINYGYGYFGTGYSGGRWRDNHFYYNTAVTRVNTGSVHNVYVDKTVIHNSNNRVSYNGGTGGVAMRQTAAQQRAFASQQHMAATQVQRNAQDAAQRDPARRYDAGHPTAGPAAGSHAPAENRTPVSNRTPTQSRAPDLGRTPAVVG
jgi:hypothetical protein